METQLTMILKRYPYLDQEIFKLNQAVNVLILNRNETYDSLQAAKLSDMPKGTGISNPTCQAVEDIICRFDEDVIRLKDEILYRFDLKDGIDKALAELTVVEREIIQCKFFQKMTMEDIAQRVNYSRTQATRICATAMQKLDKLLSGHINKKGA